MNTKTRIIIGGCESSLVLLELKEKYTKALNSYNRILELSKESNSEELDVELARAETKLETMEDVLEYLGIPIKDPLEHEIRHTLIDLLTVESIGQITKDLKEKNYEYLADLLSGQEAKPFSQFSDEELLLEAASLFGGVENFDPFQNENLDISLLEESVPTYLPILKVIIQERLYDEETEAEGE